MSLNFPTNPSPGQVYTDLATGLTYIWNNAIGAFESAEQPPTIVSETQPQTEVAGRLWFKPSSKEFKIYDGTVWITPGIINPIIMSNTAPTQRPNTQSLQNGDLWWDTVGGTLYVYYNDGDSNQWVSATPTPGIADLPPGSATNPGLSFQNDTNTGLFSSGDGNVSVTINGEQKLSIDVDGLKAVSTNGAWKIPDGTILQRPIVPTPGMIRFNIDWNRYEGYDGTVWSPLAGSLVITSLIPPSDPTPNEGDFWFNEDTGGLFLYYNDGNSSQWVQVGGTDLVDGILDVSLGGTGASTAADARTNLGVISKSGDVFTGPVGITAGTAGAPGLYVSGDINTGIFSPGADQLSITTGGTAKITVDSDSVSIPNLDFTQAGTGAVTRTVDSKLKDFVSVKDFGAVGDGVADDTTALQAAINTGKAVYLPNGVYKLTSPLTLNTVGQRLFGESSHNTYLTGGATHDQVRVAASHCEIDHIHFRPSGGSDDSPPTFAPLRVYAALARIHDNRFLSSAVNTGCAILLDDVNPATSAVVAGAYTHTISENRIGASGFNFRYGIYSYNANNGQQATKFQNNVILSDRAIYVYQGGGNYYVGNLLQSATGTYVTGAGNGIDLQAGVVGETITGNYIERYQHGVIARRTTQDYLLINAYGNHWDNNTSNITFTSSVLAAYFDEVSLYDTKNTWQWRYNSQDNLKLFNRESVETLNINRANYAVEPRVLGHNLMQSLSYTANGQTQTPTASWCEITGAGAARTGCFLGNGTRDGHHLYLRAHTWSVQLLNNPGGTQNIVFASGASSATFGQSGNVGTMHLIWDTTYGTGRWFEISRTLA